MNVVFFGSTEFTLPILQLLRERFALRLIVCHPDTAKGRGRRRVAPPAKQFGRDHDIPVAQPARIRGRESHDRIAEHEPDFVVVADYGKKIPNNLIELPTHCTLNVHPSLLPRHRGAAPIPHAILSGDTQTGITLIGMTEEIDAGPIYAQRTLSLSGRETAGELARRLAPLAAELLVEVMRRIVEEGLQPREQDHSRATHAPMLTKPDGRLDFACTAEELERRVRAMQPWPMAYCTLPLAACKEGVRVNLLQAVCEPEESVGAPGGIVGADRDGIRIATGRGVLCIQKLQPAGKKPMTARDFLNGYKLASGTAG